MENRRDVSLRTIIPQQLRTTLKRLPRYARPASAYVLPDYIIIGAQKCGTTSLDLNLAKHPFIRMALMQEVHFFDYNWHKGERWYRRNFHTRAASERNKADRGERLWTGESSPSYIHHPCCPERVRQLCPDVKLIALLRNPADRAYSHFHHERRYGWDDRSLDNAFDWDREREMIEREIPKIKADPRYFSWAYRHESYLSRGMYAEQIERWRAHFPEEQLLIVQSESFYADMRGAMRRIFSFLGVPDHDVVDASTYNANTYSKIEQGVRESLREFYEPYNERLFELIGERFDW